MHSQTILALPKKTLYLCSSRLVIKQASQDPIAVFQLLRGSVAQLEWFCI